jgi:hypothetical protein
LLLVSACASDDAANPADEALSGRGQTPVVVSGATNEDALVDAAVSTALQASDAGDGVVSARCDVVPDSNGWVSRNSNAARIQGQIRTYASAGSVILPDPAAMPPFVNDGSGRLCIRGATGMVLDQMWGVYFGAGLHIDLCGARSADGESIVRSSMASCPDAMDLLGLRVLLTGPRIPSGVRLAFHEVGRNQSTYVQAQAGQNEIFFADATVGYDPKAAGPNPGAMDSIFIVVPSVEQAMVDFDFCVEQLTPITREGVCSGG